jgi:hypothetical protein
VTRLTFADPTALEDLSTYAVRAASADPSGAIRFQAHGRTLAAYVGILPGRGLMGEGSVVGLRVAELATPSEVDTTVTIAAVKDRLARRGTGVDLELPPVTVSVPWAALAPPRSGWERVGDVSGDDVRRVAREGIAAVASGTPDGAGAHAVAALRDQVWGRPSDTVPPFPAGAAFGAHVLGFVPDDGGMTLFAHGRWVRLSSAVGHVLAR